MISSCKTRLIFKGTFYRKESEKPLVSYRQLFYVSVVKQHTEYSALYVLNVQSTQNTI